MFKRKLKALDYMFWDKVDGEDTKQFRKLVVWLEDQKIRQYTIQDRSNLRDIDNPNWDTAFQTYLQHVGCPLTSNNLDKLEWLIGLAVRLDFEDDLEKFQKEKTKSQDDSKIPSITSSNPLDNLDFESHEFKDGVTSIAKLLNIGQHPNHLITLDACSKYVTTRLNPKVLKEPNTIAIKGTPFPYREVGMGFDLGDRVLNDTAKALNLLYIQDLRNLQTSINEAIVSVQNITANPKTDTKAGKVGV